MFLALPHLEDWYGLNSIYQAALGWQDDPQVSVQSYQNPEHACREICQALAQLFPHRRTIVYVKGVTPIFEPIASQMAKDGGNVKALSLEDLAQPAAWLEPMLKDLLYLLVPEDDPITGEVFNLGPLREALKDKRSFLLSVSHASFRCAEKWEKPSAYQIGVRVLSQVSCLALLGERTRLTPYLTPCLHWPEPRLEQVKQEIALHAPGLLEQMRACARDLEASRPPGARALGFQPGSQRTGDRALYAFSDLDGLSFIEALARELKTEADAASFLATTSLCAIGDSRLVDQGLALRYGLSEQELRGLVVIGTAYVAQKNIGDAVARAAVSAAAEVRRRQG